MGRRPAREHSDGGGASQRTRRRGRGHTARALSLRLLLGCILLAVAVCAPAVHAATEVSAAAVLEPVAATAAAPASSQRDKKAARRERLAAARAQREAEKAARRATRAAEHQSINENRMANTEVTCTSITVFYKEFPELPGNTTEEVISIEKNHLIRQKFTFDGPTATHTFPFAAPGKFGRYSIDVHVKWKTNGIKGGYDIPNYVRCPPAPSYSLEKLQAISGSGEGFTTETLTGQIGQTIDYKILVTNTGNTPMTFAFFSDPRCDLGTVTRTPLGAIEPGGVVTFECTHLITAADGSAGAVENTAKLTGTPPEGLGTPIEHETNTVVVKTPPVEKETEKEKEKEPESPGAPKEEPKGGTLGSTTTSSGGTTESKTGVLGFSSQTVPGLKGPSGCVRGGFHTSVKATNVAKVVFYLDGRKLKTLTAKNAHGGLLTILINAASLKVGPHRVKAAITMTGKATATATTNAKATRSYTFVHCASAAVTPHFTG